MNFISYSDCSVSINGENYYALSASLASSATVSANRLLGGQMEEYSPNAPMRAMVVINYYVTGEIENVLSLTGDRSCYGSFGGINFSGAYLSNYSVEIAPYSQISVSSRFQVYSGFSESLSGDSFYSTGISVANAATSDLENFNSSNLGLDNPINISYSIDCQRVPSYVIGDEHPKDVILGGVNKKMSIRGENIGGLISYSGRGVAAVSITPKTINNISRGQSLTCGGVIESQSLSVARDGTVGGTISIAESIR